MSSNVAILGLGVSLPDEVRTNAWWPAHLVEEWTQKQQRGAEHLRRALEMETDPFVRLSLEAQLAHKHDPFNGAQTRRVAPNDVAAADLEADAARAALANAGISPADVDAVLTNTAVPEYHINNQACGVHLRLGLSEHCFTLGLDAACNSFLKQLILAEKLIRSGSARYALLTQSALASRVLPMDASHSPMFGDVATAVVVGPSTQGDIIASAWRTASDLANTIVTTVPNKRWYDEGKAVLQPVDVKKAQAMFMLLPHHAKDVVGEALGRAKLAPEKVDFYACHQGTAWLRAVTQKAAGMVNARSYDSFSSIGNTSACNVPYVLAEASKRGDLKTNDNVVLFSGGTGVTYASVVLRWG